MNQCFESPTSSQKDSHTTYILTYMSYIYVSYNIIINNNSFLI